jgi:hypothetical protein
MPPSDLSRRDFVLTAAAAVLSARVADGQHSESPRRRGDAHSRERRPPLNATVDGFKAGDPSRCDRYRDDGDGDA